MLQKRNATQRLGDRGTPKVVTLRTDGSHTLCSHLTSRSASSSVLKSVSGTPKAHTKALIAHHLQATLITSMSVLGIARQGPLSVSERQDIVEAPACVEILQVFATHCYTRCNENTHEFLVGHCVSIAATRWEGKPTLIVAALPLTN